MKHAFFEDDVEIQNVGLVEFATEKKAKKLIVKGEEVAVFYGDDVVDKLIEGLGEQAIGTKESRHGEPGTDKQRVRE